VVNFIHISEIQIVITIIVIKYVRKEEMIMI
jgi:hypothetical protein